MNDEFEISQAGVRRANDLIARIEDGLVGTDIGDGTLTGVDLAPDTFVPETAHPSRSTATPIGSHRKRSTMSAGAPARSRSIPSRPSRKCFQPS